MSIRFPLGLVFALVLPAVHALAQTVPSPSLSTSLPSGPLAASSPTTPVTNLPALMPSASPAASLPPLPIPFPMVPPPQRQLPPIVAPPAVGFRSAPPSAAEIDSVIPRVEIWRPGSNLPQTPKGRHQRARRLLQACVSGSDAVMVRLRFHPVSKGKAVLVKAARGIALAPADDVLRIPADGQLILSILLDPRMSESHVSFSCEGLTTTLALSRTASSFVDAREIADAANP